MSTRHVLIAGGGVAGPALAYWLVRHGIRATVVERAPELRFAGQSVDLRGAGREVVRRMGLEETVRAAGTGERGLVFTEETGRSRVAIGQEVLAGTGGEGPTAELEILRGELARVLYEATRDDVDWVFGDHVAAIDEPDDPAAPVRVRLAGGATIDADVVVAADGIGSTTRGLVFGDPGDPDGTVRLRSLGASIAYLTIPREDADTDWGVWQSSPGSRGVLMRPDNLGTVRAGLTMLTEPCLRGLDRGAQETLLRERFADVGGVGPRVLEEMGRTDEFYAEDLAQVVMPTWSDGHTVLLGDAGYAPSPISGMGTSLALVGAYVLAHELGVGDGHTAAFARYESTMRPYVQQAQKLPPGAPRIANPKTRTGIRVMHAILRLVIRRPFTAVLARLASPPADRITLPAEPAAV